MKKSPASYFDNKFKREEENFHHLQAIMRNTYNKSCFSDFLADAHLFCAQLCLRQSEQTERDLRPVEELCAKNCTKKTLNSYQLYVKMEDKISEEIVKDWKLNDIINEQ